MGTATEWWKPGISRIADVVIVVVVIVVVAK